MSQPEDEVTKLRQENLNLRMELNKAKKIRSEVDKWLLASVRELSAITLNALREVTTRLDNVMEFIESHMAKKQEISVPSKIPAITKSHQTQPGVTSPKRLVPLRLSELPYFDDPSSILSDDEEAFDESGIEPQSGPSRGGLYTVEEEDYGEGPSWLLDEAVRDTPHRVYRRTFFSVKNHGRSHRTETIEHRQDSHSNTEVAGGRNAAAPVKRKVRFVFHSDSDSYEEEFPRRSKRKFVRQEKGSSETDDMSPVRAYFPEMDMEALSTPPPLSPVRRVRGGITSPVRDPLTETGTLSHNEAVPNLGIANTMERVASNLGDEECRQPRLRRGVAVNYKEPPLNRKLRRS